MSGERVARLKTHPENSCKMETTPLHPGKPHQLQHSPEKAGEDDVGGLCNEVSQVTMRGAQIYYSIVEGAMKSGKTKWTLHEQ